MPNSKDGAEVGQFAPTVAIRLHPDEIVVLPSVTFALHCLVAIGANPPGTTALEKERAESDVALRHGSDRLYSVCCCCCGDAFGPQQQHDGDSAKSAVPEFSDEERGRIFDGVMRISDAPVTEMAAPEVANSLPEEVPMQELPTDIIREFRWFADINS